jgi:hypothetical protein
LGKDTETDALRTEAEIGAAMHCLGQHEQGMAMNRITSAYTALGGNDSTAISFEKIERSVRG